ncbi:MAG: cyclase family protein [Ktedonobacteraceae bacterium]|nr:cyclase family protein [Ktedonobacteraceae bacterium]
MRTFIDLSLPIRATPSEATPVVISALDHHEAPRVLGLEPRDFPDGMAISNEQIALTTHTGTHMDAPFHYGPLSGGYPARKIADIPLAWCYGRGVRLDVRHRRPGEEISATDIMEAEEQTGTVVSPLDIVLTWTGCDRLWGNEKYLTDYPGLGRDAVAYLVKQGVRIIGIDAWGLDRPMASMLRDYRSTGNRSYLWPAHLYGREQEYCQLEKLANLHLLPFSYGFHVICFPVSIEEAGAAWTRVVAVFE